MFFRKGCNFERPRLVLNYNLFERCRCIDPVTGRVGYPVQAAPVNVNRGWKSAESHSARRGAKVPGTPTLGQYTALAIFRRDKKVTKRKKQ